MRSPPTSRKGTDVNTFSSRSAAERSLLPGPCIMSKVHWSLFHECFRTANVMCCHMASSVMTTRAVEYYVHMLCYPPWAAGSL